MVTGGDCSRTASLEDHGRRKHETHGGGGLAISLAHCGGNGHHCVMRCAATDGWYGTVTRFCPPAEKYASSIRVRSRSRPRLRWQWSRFAREACANFIGTPMPTSGSITFRAREE